MLSIQSLILNVSLFCRWWQWAHLGALVWRDNFTYQRQSCSPTPSSTPTPGDVSPAEESQQAESEREWKHFSWPKRPRASEKYILCLPDKCISVESSQNKELICLLSSGSVVTLWHVFLFPLVSRFSLEYSQLHHHLYAEIQEQFHPQLPERVSHRATYGHTRQHHQGCGQGCQRYVCSAICHFC